jgi:uncharacterized membrane protein YgcG
VKSLSNATGDYLHWDPDDSIICSGYVAVFFVQVVIAGFIVCALLERDGESSTNSVDGSGGISGTSDPSLGGGESGGSKKTD